MALQRGFVELVKSATQSTTKNNEAKEDKGNK